MDKWKRLFLWLGCFWLFSWATLSPAQAHDGPPAIALDGYQFTPGEVVEIRGINLVSDLPVQVVLAANGREYPLGEALCNGHGDFVQVFTLPAEAETAVYELKAVDTNIPGLAPVLATTIIKIDPNPAPDTFIPRETASQPQTVSKLLRGVLVVVCLTLFVALWWHWRRPSSPEIKRLGD